MLDIINIVHIELREFKNKWNFLMERNMLIKTLE